MAEKLKRGRPTKYTPELAKLVCELLAQGKSLTNICKTEPAPPYSTVRQWVIDDVNGFAAEYARARDFGVDVMADELLEISDTPKEGVEVIEGDDGTKIKRGDMLGHRRLQVDTRKWYLSKLAPKKYGDRLDIEHSGSIDIGHKILEARKRASGE